MGSVTTTTNCCGYCASPPAQIAIPTTTVVVTNDTDLDNCNGNDACDSDNTTSFSIWDRICAWAAPRWFLPDRFFGTSEHLEQPAQDAVGVTSAALMGISAGSRLLFVALAAGSGLLFV